MKTLKKALAIILCVLMAMQIGIISYAAGNYYEATKDAKVYTKPYKDSTHVYTIAKGDVVETNGIFENSYGNLWFRLNDGYFTYSGNYKVHNHESMMCGNPSTSYEKKDASSHVKVFYQGDNLCSCGAFVSKGNTNRTTESHSFSSNKCTKCSYVATVPNTHNHTISKQINGKTTYEQFNETVHRRNIYSGDNVCSCGTIISAGSTSTGLQEHSFNSSGKCTKCNYQRNNTTTHYHQSMICGNPSTTYEKKDASYHIKVFYQGDNLCSCGAFVSKGNTTRTNEYHSFSSGKCTKCGYVSVSSTTHKHSASKQINSTTTYEKYNDSVHMRYYYYGDNVCSCGAFISKGNTSSGLETHSFDSSLKCTKCGYKEVTNHVHTAYRCTNPTTTYEQNTSSSHIKVILSGEEVCSCGYLVTKATTSKTVEYHSFNSNGNCINCNYKVNSTVHTHSSDICTPGSTSYEKKDHSYHVMVSTSPKEICSCGYVVSKSTTTRSNEYHSFDSNDKCTKCYYQKESTVHTHIAVLSKNPKITYGQQDSYQHIRFYYSGEEHCSCGYVVTKGTTTSSLEVHSYDSNLVCTKCKYDNNVIISEEDVDSPNYITVKDNVPVRTFCKKAADVAYKIEKKGTAVTVSKLVVNQVGHIWAKTSDGYYIYLENLIEAKHKEEVLPEFPTFKQCQSIKFEKGKLVHSYVTSTSSTDTHLLIKHYEKICLVCDKTVYKNDSHSFTAVDSNIYFIESEKVNHTFDKKQTCLQCGYNYQKTLEKEANLDKVSVSLAALGLIPVVGNIADALDLALNIARGHFTEAAISAMAIAPFVGQLAGSAKAAKSIEAIQDTIDAIDDWNNLKVATYALNNGTDAVNIIRNAENTDEILSVIKLSENYTDAAALGKKSTRDILLESADNQSLKNTINELYRPGASTYDGGSADALRREIITGEPVGGNFHNTKVPERINNLNNILKRKDLSASDRLLAEALRKDLQSALNRLPK